MNPLDKALQLADLGMYVFPLNGNKRPTLPEGYNGHQRGQGGFYHGTTDPAVIRQMWTDHPGTEVGVWAGPSKVACLDIDFDPTKGIDGIGTLELYELPYGSPISHPSPRGGEHHIYRAPENTPGPKPGLLSGVDRKCGASYFAWRGDVPTRQELDSLPEAPEWFMGPAHSSRATLTGVAPITDTELDSVLKLLPEGAKRWNINTETHHYQEMFEAVGEVMYFTVYDPKASGLADQFGEIVNSFMASAVTSIPEHERPKKLRDAAAWWYARWTADEFAAGYRWAWNILAYGPATSASPAAEVPAPLAAAVAEHSEGSSWEPVDLELFLSGEFKQEYPAIMHREDGPAMFYAGKVNDVHGESESGKSWIALSATSETLQLGQRVIFMDHESDPQTVIGRLLRLGVTKDQIRAGLDYRRPQEFHLSEEMTKDMAAFDALASNKAALIVIDGVTEAMGLMDMSPLDNDEIRKWWNSYPRRLARATGAAVVLIDHVVKSSDGRGRFAFGGQHKMAAVDGASYFVDVEEALGPGKIGSLKVYVTKDRPGGVREFTGKADKDRKALFAIYELDSMTGLLSGRSKATLHHFGQSKALQLELEKNATRKANVLEALEALGGYATSQSQLVAEVKKKWETVTPNEVSSVLKDLESEGKITRPEMPNGKAKPVKLLEPTA
ncbi:bifunctional DNA primase/polymerase [Microbacterium maritypicum]|uniref:DNA primase/polymerase bifunctional N-terminal domain-containing protein n=1 Tax=Microbacterium maritypicum MF109 TaxID=1333857 RepID=T5KNP9_MICMQ|nr:bifunctional DNA primase/polymerase [Microbacterium liquefaciens]EQM78198.1 hypothetical protein L687_16865 [Microbacterium maritypicum MF109]